MLRTRPIIALLLSLLLLSPLGAQTDPEGWDLAQKLEARFEANDRDGFLTLFQADPALSRRAYLAAMEMGLHALREGRDEEGGKDFIVAAALAFALDREMDDPVPARVMKAFEGYDPQAIQILLDYSDAYYSGYRPALQSVADWLAADVGSGPAESEQGTKEPSKDSDYKELPLEPAEVNDEYFELARPYLVKLQRIAFAGIFADQSLVLQELETYPIVEREVNEKADTADLGKRLRDDFSFVRPEMELAQLRLLAEMGLLDEFDAKIPNFLSGSTHTNSKLGLLHTGYKVALRTQSWEKAEGYLSKMGRLLEGDEPSPVFSYTLKTSEFELKVAKGYQAKAEEIVAEFNRAWSLLDSYQPITRVQEDIHWHSARESTKFWLDQLTALEDAQNLEAVVRINEQCSRWLSQVDVFEKTLDELNDNQLLFHSSQMQGYLTVIISNLDIVMYIFETWQPMLDDRENYAGVVEPFPQVLENIASSAAKMSPDITEGPGFPPFQLSDSFLLAELRARSRYLLSLDPANSAEQKLTYLEKTSEYVDMLEQPESFIDYQILLGKSFSGLQKHKQAIEAWGKAYELAKDRRFVRRSLEAASMLAEEYGRSGEWEKAAALATEASSKIEGELDGASGSRLAALNTKLAEIRTRAAVESDSPEEALKALAQNQQVQAASLRLRGESDGVKATQELQSKKKTMALLSRKVTELEQRPSSVTRDELLEKTEKLLAQSKSDFLLQSRRIRKRFSQLYTTALRFDPLNLPDIQDVLPEETAVVQYFPTQDELYIFVVSRDKFRLRSVSQQKAVLDRQVLAYLRQLKEAKQDNVRWQRLSQDLHATLISPILEDVSSSTTLVLIPAGKLNLLPFGSLMSPEKRYLIEDKVLLELAKPTDFLKIALRKPGPIGRVVAFANATEDLPAAEMEGQMIKKLFPKAQLFNGKNASKANFMEFGKGADILHFATHGTWDAKDSLKNHLKLSNDETLGQEEIFDLSLDKTSIVTLSACSTALGEIEDVEYVASLAEAFWIAGSDSVVASLWQVEDRSTSLMMGKFYQELKDGKPRGEALRIAQLEVRNSPGFEHPYFWSGFLLFGDYR